ncbi:septin-7 isoform X6 [Sitodiplosis mosellana]|uniref:septin-7 isoform X6 n=1 Tax=Sitodiplosis mosellana TaxID=263140 RepID=UPI002443E0EA|nr:septin-7 isoform X6 [Sitodiplosis mosellana]XP_055319223.1 septin-7 isoform X6 [Sitodiplosis mosellana]XP_055319224.1 septin-7 isoform X6 [Sitodiplosis mosellana]XP_055319225.1 septin-7 isoform X6 [Sitodiplosis mosellana]XP_055319226.1 septin-7 isoform X6 [Sitodiplosis mosellana]
MSAPVQTQSQQQQQASTPTGQPGAPVTGPPPPVPPTKPILSSPGAYMANFSSTTTTPTAGIHSVNKSHEKPAIAARPIPPPTLPKYSSSFSKVDRDRDRNEFSTGPKIDRAEREKLQTKREMFFKSESQQSQHSPMEPPPNPPHINHVNSSLSAQTNGSGTPTSEKNTTVNNHSNASTPTTAMNNVINSLNSISLKEANNHKNIENNHQDSNKIVSERLDKEKQLQQQQQLIQQQQTIIRPKPKELDGYVGFANLPNQVYRKAVKRGFEFTLMVVGESGLGKSTLINSMFLADIYNQDQHPGPSHRIKKTVAVETTKVLLKENGVNLTLTVVDTPGFGDAVDNSNCWVPIIDFVEAKYEEYLTAESRVHRKALTDNRVHSCLYFIAPSGHGLKPLDVEFMQRLCDKVNIIPVIAKADTMTPEEVQLFKKQILNEIAQHKIKIYDFPEPLEDEEEAKVLRQLRSRVPFAIVGANSVVEIDGRKVRGRRYPWGTAEVENLDHCDFIALRNMIIRTHLQDLKDVTNNVHYENYRCRKLAGLGTDGKQSRLSNKNPLAQMEEEKREHDMKMKKMEAEMEQVFEMKVKEKKQKLKDSEAELTRRHEERKKALEMQIRELEERKRAFEQEKHEWESTNGITVDELKRRSLEANSKETGSLTSRGSDESKSRRVFGSLLRRHTSFGAPDNNARVYTTTHSSVSTLSQENHEMK